jgi:hypothetical protein
MAKKPSAMKRTGKAVASPAAKAKKAASKLGGASGLAVKAISKRKAATKKALKGY